MRFMTWNVWGRLGDGWLRRQRAIAETVCGQRPDFVALQEIWSSDGEAQAGLLGLALGMTPVFAPSRMPQDPDPGVQLGLGTDSLRFITGCLDWEGDDQRERSAQATSLAALVSELKTGGDEDHGRPPSDHYAVVADVPVG
ncbi:hypothetical protein JOF29_003136 [Kribbella aluminosa]|uniref:Endonuclease/exonuclease/phosphatase domain-containing protein n=2 Tax=Kribbella aluminosa TaxID=416017 RepID=A0ABS4UK66_9ACTN|nr:hypothetical protein [Kribbella aluminosa]